MIEFWPVILLSLRVAVVAVIFSLPFAVLIAYIIARYRFRGRALLIGAVHMPLVLPPVVTGYALLVVLGPQSWAGGVLKDAFGLQFAFRWQGAALAAAVMAFPLMVRSIWLSIDAVSPRIENAAATLGAAPFQVFRSITLPLIAPGIIAGTVLGFAKAIGEFGATITFAANIPGQSRTLPTAIYTALQTPGGEQDALIFVAASIFIAIFALLISEWVAHKAAYKGTK